MHKFFTDGVHNLTPTSGTSRGGSREAGAYLQDSWKAAPGVTVNAGLRWDQENLRDYRGVAVIRFANEWQPRLGVAWDPWRDGKTNVYAFAGRFYYSLPTDVAVRAFGGVPASVTYNFSPTDVTPVDVRPELMNRLGTVGAPNLVDSGLRGISLDELTIGVERLIDPTLSIGLKASYRGLHNTVEDRCDIDYNAPGSTNQSQCAMMDPGGDGKYARGDFYYCNGADPGNNCILDPSDPERFIYGAPPAAAPANGSTRESSSSRERASAIGCGSRPPTSTRRCAATTTAKSTKAWAVRPTPASIGTTTTRCSSRTPQAACSSTGPIDFRLAGYYRTPLGLSVGFDAYVISGAPLDRWGYFNAFYDDAPRAARLGRAACRRSGRRT